MTDWRGLVVKAGAGGRRAGHWAMAHWRLSLAMIAMLPLVILLLWTAPPAFPSHHRVVAAWKPSESWLFDRNGVLIDSMRVDFQARRLGWVPLEQISPALIEQVISAEDKRFRDHGGVDWLALGSAIRARFDGSRSRGASTLSMQVAGFLDADLARPGARGWTDKLRQIRAGMALDGQWSKDEILEAYLNLAGFRGEAQGVGAAALSLFGKAPDALGPTEAALMTALLPDPAARPDRIAARACRLAPTLDCAMLRQSAQSMTSTARVLALDPGLARHLSARILTEPGLKFYTTLDRQTQVIATIALRRQMAMLGRDRARDGAVIVVDNASGEVLAYVGGVGGDSTAAHVDGANALRQAGSTLKPFLYGMAMEKGVLTPASILDDSPVQLDTASGLYVPQNYDHAYKGPVSVRTALAASLNIPAVRTLILTGPDAFRDRLWDSGYRSLTEDGQFYGFSLALGSAEVTLLEQASAYRGLALGGRWSPLRLLKSDKAEPPRQIISPQAAWLVSDILADPVARAGTFGMDSALKLPFWAAAKTGTSKGMRDNWCVGYSDRYTVAVWVGNLEGDSMKAVSGTSGAAPVWRDVMMALHQSEPGGTPAPPPGIVAQTVRYDAGVESPRREWFLAGTQQAVQAATPAESQRPRIASPVSGSIYALDPDIPAPRQKMAVTLRGEVRGHRLTLDKRDIGAADRPPSILAPPGAHRLALVDPSGKVVDQVLFTVR